MNETLSGSSLQIESRNWELILLLRIHNHHWIGHDYLSHDPLLLNDVMNEFERVRKIEIDIKTRNIEFKYN
jgi:hypothetical protein